MNSREEEIASALPADLDALPRLRGFRLRGMEMTRLETFVDATFAFAITTLVIAAGDPPTNVKSLLAAFNNVPAFAASVFVLALFWRGHWLWSRRFGLEDGPSVMISWAMIFTMLIYVYPLKVVFGAMFFPLSGGRVGQPLLIESIGQARELFAAFALGFTAIALEIALLNLHAWRLRMALRLNHREQLMAWQEARGWALPTCVGLVSLVFALTLPPALIGWSGWVYYSLAVITPTHRWLRRRALARLDVE